MQLINVATVALNQTPLEWSGNLNNIRAALAAAREQSASIVCLPELAITGYGCEDAFFSSDIQRRAIEVLEELKSETKDLIVSVGLPLFHAGNLYNCVALLADGQLLGFVAKSNLAGDGIHYEPRWFKPWPDGQEAEYDLEDETYPIGSLVFDIGGVRIGIEICEDAWAANRPGTGLAAAAVDLILNPSASHFAFGKQEVRRRLVLESSRAFGVTYVYANLLGNEAGRVIYDGAAMVASSGQMEAEGPRLSFADFVVTTACVDIDKTRMSRARLASFRPDADENGQACIQESFTFPEIEPRAKEMHIPSWESAQHVKEEEFARTVALGLFDYLRKSRSNGFVVSLSGGADSSAVATLVWLAVQFGVSELGPERFLEKLAYIEGLTDKTEPSLIMRELLACVYQATRNSSDTTENAARELASAIEATYLRFDVDSIVESYVDLVENQIDRQLNWDKDDIALQNIQARVRAPGVWLLANLRNSLLLATSNRSEAAVGYATMDGDTCGGLSPIAGIDKAFLRQWLMWMCETGPEEIGNVPALSSVTSQIPTAELRPLEAEQTDEDDLMPYDLLDSIERAAIRDKNGPVDILRMMRVEFPAYPAKQLAVWIERFFRLWARNQWKRERYAPSFHLDDENLDPKTWCRFPILSGGFDEELSDMQKLLKSGKSAPHSGN